MIINYKKNLAKIAKCVILFKIVPLLKSVEALCYEIYKFIQILSFNVILPGCKELSLAFNSETLSKQFWGLSSQNFPSVTTCSPKQLSKKKRYQANLVDYLMVFELKFTYNYGVVSQIILLIEALNSGKYS